MKKAMYSDDVVWYDTGIHNAITTLAEEYSNAIPVFGGALGAYNCINSDEPDFKGFINALSTVAQNAKFYKWHEGIVGALRRFCRLCLIDPALIEAYIGSTFHEIYEVA